MGAFASGLPLFSQARHANLSSPRSIPSSSRSPRLDASQRAQRSLSPSALSTSPTTRTSSYGSQLLSVPGSASSEADGLSSPTGFSPDISRHRRGSRSSILASASEATGASATSDRESIRSVGSSSRAGPSIPRQRSPRASRNEERERNASPVSFYSVSEAPLTSPRRSHQGSMQIDSTRASFNEAGSTSAVGSPQGASKHNGLSAAHSSKAAAPTSPNTMPATSHRGATDRRNVTNPTSAHRSASAQHRRSGQEPKVPTLMPFLSSYSSQSNLASQNQPPLQNDRAPSGFRYEPVPSSAASVVSQTRSISSSRSVASFRHLDPETAARPRSKSSASSSEPSKSPAPTQSASSSGDIASAANMPPPAGQPTKAQPNASAPTKLSLRSRIFGLKNDKAASNSPSSADSGNETPSPKSAHFPPSLRSERSHSDHHSDTHSVEQGLPSPGFAASHSGHDCDDASETGDAAGTDPRSDATRKSSGASSFLRKTIRFKDKSAFLKTRPSVSSMTSESAASTSASVPPSPADPPSGSNVEDSIRKVPVYKQVSGRRGPQYHDASGDQTLLVPRASTDRLRNSAPNALLPPVTERDREGQANLLRSNSSLGLKQEPARGSSSSSSQSKMNGSLAGAETASVPRPPSSRSGDHGARTHIPRSSSLHGSVGRGSKLGIVPPSNTSVDRSVSSPMLSPEVPDSPRRRPRSGSANSFVPQIQPRTTSSPLQGSVRRPVTVQGSPSFSPSPYASGSPANRVAHRLSRPKTADSGHSYSGSLPSLRDILTVAHAISEEGAVYNTPENKDMPRFEANRIPSPATSSKFGVSPGESKRPGLPPKNPLRKQRPSGVSVNNTPLVSGDSPASAHTTGVVPGPAMSKPDERLLIPVASNRDSIGPLSPSSSTPSLAEYRTPTSEPGTLPSTERHTADDDFRSREIARQHGAQLGQIPSRSPGVSHGTHSGASSPAHSTFASVQQLSRAPSSESTAGWASRRHERAASDATSSMADLRSVVQAGASTPSLHSETSSGTRKKKDGTGSKMFSFARDFSNREGSETNATMSSSATFRLGRSSKSKKGDATVRPVIRRLYDGPLEGEAAALALRQGVDAHQSPLQFTNGVSPRSSVADLSAAAAMSPRTPGGYSPATVGGRQPSSASLVRSASSTGSTARDMMTPASTHLLTPQIGRNGSGVFLARSPNFVKPSWSIPQENLSQEQKRLVKRWYTLRELLETERAYASDLAVARDIYLARAKLRAGITAPLSPLSVRSASIFSQLASPEPSTHSRSSQPYLQQRGTTSTLSSGPSLPSGKGALPQRTLFRNASGDATAISALANPNQVNQTASSASLTSSNPSNRSSMYTVSSQSSQTSDASHFALSGHPTFSGGFSTSFSIDGNPLSPATGVKLTPGASMVQPSPAISPYSSTPATPSISSPSEVMSPGLIGSNEGSTTSTPDAPFSASDVRIVFAQLESCAAFADEMVAILESAVGKMCSGTAEEACQLLAQGEVREESETDRVGQAFLKLMPRIEQVYSAYCSRHEASMSKLQELLSTQPKVAAFLAECTQAARAYTNAWDLSSLLIKPVQRVLKYPLLLSQILASTSSKHPDMGSLSAASVEIQKVADNINEVKKRKDLVEQIVSGKTAKRTTGQRMQHGATKKLLRRQEKVKKLVLGPTEDILADGGQYKAMVTQFRQLEKATTTFSRRCTAWSLSVKEAHVAQLKLLDQWCRAYAVDEMAAGTEAETRLRAFMHLIERTFLSDYWSQLDSEIRTSLTPAVQRIAALFILPQSVIAKRNDREPDYTRYRAEITRGGVKAADKKLTESANAFIALHTQLMNELPQFNYGIQTLLDLCIESLSRTQASYHFRVHRSLISFWQSFGPEGNSDIAHNEETDEKSMRHLNPVKIFWPLHSSVAGYAESLGIVTGIVVDDRSRSASMSTDSDFLAVGNLSPVSNNHFSPLQSTRALPDSEFASKVPDASSMSQQIESITAAGSEELLDPVSARTSPFTAPPLGSRRPSFPRQLHQQHLLGSPAPIGSSLPSGSGPPPLRSQKSSGLIVLLRSVGNSSAMSSVAGSRKNSQSTDHTAMESFVDGLEGSNPPTPISKDTPLMNRRNSNSEDAPAPTLPALSFNSGFFGQSNAVFTSASASVQSQGLGVEIQTGQETKSVHPPTSIPESVVAGEDRTVHALKRTSNPTTNFTPSLSQAAFGTMAAVANSPTTTEGRGMKNGFPFVQYSVGDLFRVTDAHEGGLLLFGHSEHGITGWVERENFVPLS
ncbi:uncharacterized protein UHOD_14773 [Ustilago sp. UG-2017b]|nr:uncharacterized protein UHOD_14773 [Ustilago sp. UG-2017b]